MQIRVSIHVHTVVLYIYTLTEVSQCLCNSKAQKYWVSYTGDLLTVVSILTSQKNSQSTCWLDFNTASEQKKSVTLTYKQIQFTWACNKLKETTVTLNCTCLSVHSISKVASDSMVHASNTRCLIYLHCLWWIFQVIQRTSEAVWKVVWCTLWQKQRRKELL